MRVSRSTPPLKIAIREVVLENQTAVKTPISITVLGPYLEHPRMAPGRVDLILAFSQ